MLPRGRLPLNSHHPDFDDDLKSVEVVNLSRSDRTLQLFRFMLVANGVGSTLGWMGGNESQWRPLPSRVGGSSQDNRRKSGITAFNVNKYPALT